MWSHDPAQRNVGPQAIRVVLQIAGQTDRDARGAAGRLIASIGNASAGDPPYAIEALVLLDEATRTPRLGVPTRLGPMPEATWECLRTALDAGWQTARGVDLVDEQARPLLLGALDPHPAGVSRWLRHYFQDGR